MKGFLKLNINDSVRFKLTDYGKELYYHRYDNVPGIEPSFPREDEEGYVTMQLWDFMLVYGSHFGLANPQIIQNNTLQIPYDELLAYDWNFEEVREMTAKDFLRTMNRKMRAEDRVAVMKFEPSWWPIPNYDELIREVKEWALKHPEEASE